MPENENPTVVTTFNHKEIVEALIKHQGITGGIWMLHVEFVMAAGSIPGPEGKILPSALIGITKIGIAEKSTMNDLSVDASTLLGAKDQKRSKGKKASKILTGTD